MREMSGEDVKKIMEKRDIDLKTGSLRRIPQEAPSAYKDVDEVVKVIDSLGICKKVVRLKPLAVLIG